MVEPETPVAEPEAPVVETGRPAAEAGTPPAEAAGSTRAAATGTGLTSDVPAGATTPEDVGYLVQGAIASTLSGDVEKALDEANRLRPRLTPADRVTWFARIDALVEEQPQRSADLNRVLDVLMSC